MSAIEAEIRRKVIQWLNYADEDIQLARHALTLSTDVPYGLSPTMPSNVLKSP